MHIYTVYSEEPNGNKKARTQLRNIGLELSSALQSPQEAASIFAVSSAIHACYRAAGNCGILSTWPKEEMTAEDLAKKTGADVNLIGESQITMEIQNILIPACSARYANLNSVRNFLGERRGVVLAQQTFCDSLSRSLAMNGEIYVR